MSKRYFRYTLQSSLRYRCGFHRRRRRQCFRYLNHHRCSSYEIRSNLDLHSDDLKRKNGDDDLDGVVDDDEKRNRIDERNRRIKLKAFNNDGHQRRNHVSFDENQIENLRQQQQQHQHQHQQQHHHQQQRNQESMIDELQSQNKLDNNSSSDLVDREPKQQQPQSQWKRDAIDDSQNYDNHLLKNPLK
ncbi:hypothetical protein SSS_00733 [Sarcoptes scabiei]|uniref:Uncharacterized protein n=1 Tax=Sarcoptes scabiei TaxID=52283 RepID=A0A834RCP4_SARSC|nr:hypothetical protein SSS_00733 [Sarcoptes scabiei]